MNTQIEIDQVNARISADNPMKVGRLQQIAGL